MKLIDPCVFLSWSAARKGVVMAINHGNPQINAMIAKMRRPFHLGFNRHSSVTKLNFLWSLVEKAMELD